MLTQSQTETKLDAEIHALLKKLEEDQDKTSEEYATIVDRISKLHKLKSEEAQNQIKIEEIATKFEADRRLKLPSSDTALVVAANILGILLITRYEREGVITSKAFGNILKPR